MKRYDVMFSQIRAGPAISRRICLGFEGDEVEDRKILANGTVAPLDFLKVGTISLGAYSYLLWGRLFFIS